VDLDVDERPPRLHLGGRRGAGRAICGPSTRRSIGRACVAIWRIGLEIDVAAFDQRSPPGPDPDAFVASPALAEPKEDSQRDGAAEGRSQRGTDLRIQGWLSRKRLEQSPRRRFGKSQWAKTTGINGSELAAGKANGHPAPRRRPARPRWSSRARHRAKARNAERDLAQRRKYGPSGQAKQYPRRARRRSATDPGQLRDGPDGACAMRSIRQGIAADQRVPTSGAGGWLRLMARRVRSGTAAAAAWSPDDGLIFNLAGVISAQRAEIKMAALPELFVAGLRLHASNNRRRS